MTNPSIFRNSSKVLLRPRCTALLLVAALVTSYGLQAQSVPVAVAGLAAESSSSAGSAALPEAPTAAAVFVDDGALANPRSLASGSSPGGAVYEFRSAHERGRAFVFDLIGPTAFIAPAFQSGIDTARPLKVAYPPSGYLAPGKHPAHGDVPEWGLGAQGYAKRYADRFGQGLVTTTSRYALGELLRQDVTYHRCECSGLLPRTRHALLGAFIAHTRSGLAIPSLPALAAPFIGSEVAVAGWYPDRFNSSDALRISLLNYVAEPFKNLYSEFLRK